MFHVGLDGLRCPSLLCFCWLPIDHCGCSHILHSIVAEITLFIASLISPLFFSFETTMTKLSFSVAVALFVLAASVLVGTTSAFSVVGPAAALARRSSTTALSAKEAYEPMDGEGKINLKVNILVNCVLPVGCSK